MESREKRRDLRASRHPKRKRDTQPDGDRPRKRLKRKKSTEEISLSDLEDSSDEESLGIRAAKRMSLKPAGGAQKQDIVPQKRKPVGNKPIKTKQKKEKPVPKSSKVKPKPSAKPKVPKPPAKRTNTSRKKDGKSKGTADIRSFFS